MQLYLVGLHRLEGVWLPLAVDNMKNLVYISFEQCNEVCVMSPLSCCVVYQTLCFFLFIIGMELKIYDRNEIERCNLKFEKKKKSRCTVNLCICLSCHCRRIPSLSVCMSLLLNIFHVCFSCHCSKRPYVCLFLCHCYKISIVCLFLCVSLL